MFKKIIRISVSCILFFFLVICINNIVVVKYTYDTSQPHTETYKGFYKMKQDSVDVLILGTSHASTGFNPQDFYDTNGLRAYNLASSGQSVYMSYYWLKEALRYQNPSVVIFDVLKLFSDNNNEGSDRKSLDNMRFGRIKFEAAKTIVDYDPEQTVISYLFPFIRYHNRWNDLNENDFICNNNSIPLLKGFWIFRNIALYSSYNTIEEDIDENRTSFKELSFLYFRKIVSLCEEKGIHLLVVKTPVHTFNQARHNTVKGFTEKNGLLFVDFNTTEIYNKIAFQYGSGDISDVSENNAHANLSGARKMSTYLADLIIEKGWAGGIKDEQWEVSKEFNDGLYKDFELHNTKDLETYLGMLKDERYTVILSTKEGMGTELSEVCIEKLEELGLSSDWNSIQKKSYLAMIEKGKVRLDKSMDEEYRDSFRNGVMRIIMSSGDGATIQINEKEESKNLRGLNIVVYNNDRKCVIDSVNFDTFDERCTCYR